MNLLEIKKMSTLERLQTMEAIWSTLLYDANELEPPEWHQEVLTQRKNKIAQGTAEFISIEELKNS